MRGRCDRRREGAPAFEPSVNDAAHSAEIVVGKLAAALAQYASCIAIGLPILIVLPLFGGVDSRWILLAYAGTCSTAYFLAGLSIVISTAARTVASAVGAAVGLASIWCSLPVLLQLVVPSTVPRLWPWISVLNEWFLASTPSGVILVAVGSGPGWSFVDSIIWMIGLQLSAGSVLIVWAVARFRGASRDEDRSEGASRRLNQLGALFAKRPRDRSPSAENPVLWKELHTARPRGIAEAVGLLIALGFVSLIGYGTYVFARPAFSEWFANGLGPATSEAHREKFNEYLRSVSGCVEFLILLIVAAVAAGGVTTERARETWDSLIATPLSGRAILRAKGVGAIWKVRWVVLLLVVFWSVGLMTGSLHPLGFVAALGLLAVAIGFMEAMGTYQSLVSRDTPQASNRTLVPALLLMCSFVACFVPPRIASVVMGCGSVPFVTMLTLASYADIDELVMANETFGRLESIGIYTYESPLRVLATYLFGTAGFAVGARWYHRAAVIRFDQAVGRPERAGMPREEPVPSAFWWRKGTVLSLISLTVILSIAFVIPSWRDQLLLDDALAETDRLHPGWRLEDLESARRQVPELTNGALRVLESSGELPARWQSKVNTPSDAEQKRRSAVVMLAPTQCLAPGTVELLQADLNEVGAALAEARALMDFSEGRFPIAWASDGISTPLPHLAKTRDVVNLLAYDVLLRTQKQETDEALLSCRALLNVGRSLGDEPTAVSQRLRIDIRNIASEQIEFALAHGQPSEPVLASLQGVLDSEEGEPLLASSIKSERALMDRLLTSVESGIFTPRQVRNTTFFSTVLHLFRHSTAVRTAHLRFCNLAEEYSTRPAAEQLAAFGQLERSTANLAPQVQAFVPVIRQMASAFQQSRARLRCASVALAVERYRLDRGTWPSSLGSLVPGFRATVPTDPFGGEPLHLRQLCRPYHHLFGGRGRP